MKMFELNIEGESGTATVTDLTDTNKPFGKAWQNFLRELVTTGVKINTAKGTVAGKSINLPVDVHAGGVR